MVLDHPVISAVGGVEDDLTPEVGGEADAPSRPAIGFIGEEYIVEHVVLVYEALVEEAVSIVAGLSGSRHLWRVLPGPIRPGHKIVIADQDRPITHQGQG